MPLPHHAVVPHAALIPHPSNGHAGLTAGPRAMDEGEKGDGEHEGEGEGPSPRPPPSAAPEQPDPELLASMPGLRWQVVGAQRYMWGLDDVAFAPQLQRHREKLTAARRPPMARPRQAAAAAAAGAGVQASGAGGAFTGGAGSAAAPAAGVPGLERLVGAPPPVQAPLDPLDPAAAAAAAAWQLVAGPDSGGGGGGGGGQTAASLYPSGEGPAGTGSGSTGVEDQFGGAAAEGGGEVLDEGDQGGDDVVAMYGDAHDPSQDREAVRDMGDEVVELVSGGEEEGTEEGQWRGRFNDEDEAEAVEEAEEDEYEWSDLDEEEEEDEYERNGWEAQEAEDEEEEAEEGQEEEKDEDTDGPDRAATLPPGMAPQAASAPPLGAPAPYAYGTFAAAGAGDPRNFVMAAGAGAVPTGVAGVDAAAVAELHPRYRDLVLVEDELERLALMEVGGGSV